MLLGVLAEASSQGTTDQTTEAQAGLPQVSGWVRGSSHCGDLPGLQDTNLGVGAPHGVCWHPVPIPSHLASQVSLACGEQVHPSRGQATQPLPWGSSGATVGGRPAGLVAMGPSPNLESRMSPPQPPTAAYITNT